MKPKHPTRPLNLTLGRLNSTAFITNKITTSPPVVDLGDGYKRRPANSGYTLMETLIALSIMLLILVPLLSRMLTVRQMHHANDSLTAACILEQESVLVRLSSQAYQPVKKRTVMKSEWTITMESNGAPLIHYRLQAAKAGQSRGRVEFYRFSAPREQ
jgi:prepilin-type N-terminal cleavage/methylation domain-containing protein